MKRGVNLISPGVGVLGLLLDAEVATYNHVTDCRNGVAYICWPTQTAAIRRIQLSMEVGRQTRFKLNPRTGSSKNIRLLKLFLFSHPCTNGFIFFSKAGYE